MSEGEKKEGIDLHHYTYSLLVYPHVSKYVQGKDTHHQIAESTSQLTLSQFAGPAPLFGSPLIPFKCLIPFFTNVFDIFPSGLLHFGAAKPTFVAASLILLFSSRFSVDLEVMKGDLWAATKSDSQVGFMTASWVRISW